jgi:integrase
MANKKGVLTTTTYLEWEKSNYLIQKLLKEKKYKIALLISIGTYTGLRIGDILQLKWEDILNKDSYTLAEQKTKKVRTITYNAELKRFIVLCASKMNRTTNNEFVFINRFGTKPISLQYTNNVLKLEIKEAKYKMGNVCSHFMRKTFGRRVWDINNRSEESLIKLSEVFGHSNIAITRRYLGIRQEEIADVYLNL